MLFLALILDPPPLCFHWQGSYFADSRGPFGYQNGSMFLTQFTDYIHYVMRCNSLTVVNYVDDLLGLENPDISDSSFNFLLKILSQAGFSISHSKLCLSWPPLSFKPKINLQNLSKITFSP